MHVRFAYSCVFLAVFGMPTTSLGQPASWATPDPREFGLDVPAGPISAGNDLPVLTNGTDGTPVVGKVLVNIGDNRVVLMPDGELVARSAEQSQATDRKFVPITADELMKRLSAGPLSSFNIKKTRHYVYVYNTSEEFATVASKILESMIPGMLQHAKQQKIDTREPEVPLVAIMFRTRQQFDDFRRMPDGVVAYYHTLSNQVVMYEESPLWQLKRDLALQQSISTIAHEGAHQILHNIGVQQRLSLWPMWLSEGLAEYYAPTSFGKNLKWKGAGVVNDMRMFELEMYLKGREAGTPDGEMIQHTVSAARLTSTGYASAWSLTHYLAKMQKEPFNVYLREMSRLRPFEGSLEVVAPGVIPGNLKLFREHFGEDLAALEERLVKHLKSQEYNDPFGEWPHFVATVEVANRRKPRREANLFHSPEMARKWVLETVQALPEEQRSQARQGVEEFPNRVTAEQFARRFLGKGK